MRWESLRRKNNSDTRTITGLLLETTRISKCPIRRKNEVNNNLSIPPPIAAIRGLTRWRYAGSLNTRAASICWSGASFLNTAGWSSLNGQRSGKLALTSVAVQTFWNPYRSATERHLASSFEKMTTLWYWCARCLNGVWLWMSWFTEI